WLGEVAVQDGIRRTHETLAQLMRHEHASLALAQRCSAVPGHIPLFAALLNYRHSPAEQPSKDSSANHEGIRLLSSEERTNYPLTLSIDDLGGEFELTVQVIQPLSAQRVYEYMHQALSQLVRALEQAPQTPAWSIDVLSEAEQRRMLVEWNQIPGSYQRQQGIHELFEAQVRRAPDATALVHAQEHLSYAQ